MARKEWPRPLQRKPRRLASAALALALATTLAPSYFPSGVNQASAAPVVQPAALPQATPTADNQIIDADMIASGRVTKAANLTDAHGVGKGLISGHVYLTTPDGNPGAAYDNGNVKMDGITVYAQFRDKDGSYSPIFSAKTHTLPDVVGGNGGKGTFAFGTGKKGITWTDKLGREHTWAARTDQKHRIWVEPYTNERGNRVEMFRQANGWTPGSFNGVVDGPMGSFVAADGNMQLMAAFMREVPPNHETSWMAAKGDKLVEDPKGPIKNASGQLRESNVLSGQVWLETGGSPDWGFPATGPKRDSVTQDPAADGYTVYASTLTKDGAAANAKLQAQFKNDPDKLSEETKKMLEAHPEYILKTVYGKTDPSGNYSLRFGDYTNKNQTREDFLNPNHVFVWVENKDGVVQNGYTGFHTPIFQRFDAGGNFKPADAVPAENQAVTSRVEDLNTPRYGKPVNSLYNVRHALMPYAPVSIKADYNATDKPAAPGTKVTPEFSGELSSLPSKIEWRDQKGKVLKTCELDQSKNAKDQVAACTFDIPADAQKGDVYNVVVVSGGNDVAAWTVLVTKDSDEYTPAYEEKLVVPGKETKSSPKFTDKNGKETKAPEGSKFSIPGDFKAPEGYVVTIDENTGEITVTFPDKSKLSKDTVEEFEVPVTVTYPDGSTDEAPAKFKLDTDGDGDPDVTDPDDDNDGIPDDEDSNPKVPDQNTIYEPAYEEKLVVPGQETKSSPTFTDKEGKDVTVPEGSKFSIPEDFKAPEGYEVKIDENTGEITVTFPDGSKLNKDTVEEFEVPVTVTYPDGTKDEAPAKFKLDTDGDGDPDVTDPDDDNDGIPDDEDSNPKVPNQNTIYEPGYEDGSGKPGEDVKIDKPGFKDKDGKDTKAPEGTKFTPGENVPDGVKIDENTGEITVTIPEDAKPGDKITVPVVVTYPDGTKDNTEVTVTVEQPDAPDTKQNEEFEPGYEDGSGKPGEDVTVPAPEFKDKDGKDTKAPEGTKFTPGEDAPEGVTIDENTGEITVTIPEDAKPGDKITVPVVVTYPDGTKDNVDVTVTVEQPDAPDTKQNEEFEPGYEDGSGKPGEDVTVPAPEFKDKDGKDTKAPEGTKFTPGEDVPDGVTIDEKTGEITVTIPEDAKPGDKITVPVVVTYPDGSKDNTEVTVTVEEPEAKDNETYEPAYDSKLVVPGEETKSSPTFTDKDGKDVEVPADSKFKITDGFTAPEGYVVTIDESTGEITVTFPDKSKLNKDTVEEFDVPVTVTYPDKSTDEVKANFKLDTDGDGDPDVTDPDDDGDGIPDEDDSNPKVPNQNEHFEPGYEDGSGKPGEDVTVPAPEFKDKDGKDTKAPEGTKFTPGEDAPEGVTIDENTGEITVTIPEDAKPGDKITVPVVVTYPDGTKDNVDVTVTVEQPDAPDTKPDWKDDSGKPGDKVEIPNTGGDVPEGSTVETEGPGKAEIDEDGNLVVDIDKDAKPGDKIVVIVKDKDGNEIDTVTVTVEQPDAPETEKPDWNDDSGKPGDKVEIPNTGGDVPEGSTVETEGPGKAEIDEDGNLVVDIDKDAKPGDKIVVIVKDKDGNEIDRVVVEVEKPDAPETTKPDWKDGKTTPDKPIVIPNEGGKVPDGSTIEVTGPGTAELGKDGSITVTPSDDAKPGDKIVVVVKDKDGNVLDTITVEITEGALKPGKPRPGMPSTGADDSAAGAMALGGVLAAVAAGVAAARRRRD